ncbi:LysE family translocator [Saccharothrix violaceirubra]|uniref:Threonine/homoserine/homoserine lactone efflux protein n=1 Tax=Saccharothrix violaceirubra TaxID=413306 RepID=A0A7W7TAF6_9PSEU|nr:LysE family translocator [Saccharothrix violaceirubra]MBB4969431.1 threonine/homoserine/homoserine lactone efflux protein [Saccharothrix violaceirubra]
MISAAFVLTCLAVSLSPGQTLAVVIDQSLRAGRSAGLAAVAGNTVGLVFWAAASTLGLTVLVRTSQVAFLVLKVVGAVYLCWLGVQAFRRAGRVKPAAERKGSFRAGVVANVTNPKAAALYLALFPQFLPADGGTFADTATLAVVQMAISFSYYSLVVLAVHTVRRFLDRPAVRRALDRLTGFALVVLGVRMLTLTRSAV